MQKIIYFFLLILILGCSSPNLIKGKYTSAYNGHTGETLEIMPDSTFIFYWYAGLAGEGETKGKWKVHGNKLLLNSYRQPEIKPSYILIENSEKQIDSIHIEITDESLPKYGASCILFLENKIVGSYISNSQGIVNLEKNDFDKIKIQYLGFKEINFTVKNKKLNFYKFQMLPEEKWYWYFTNEKWKIDKDKLYSKRIVYKKS